MVLCKFVLTGLKAERLSWLRAIIKLDKSVLTLLLLAAGRQKSEWAFIIRMGGLGVGSNF